MGEGTKTAYISKSSQTVSGDEYEIGFYATFEGWTGTFETGLGSHIKVLARNSFVPEKDTRGNKGHSDTKLPGDGPK